MASDNYSTDDFDSSVASELSIRSPNETSVSYSDDDVTGGEDSFKELSRKQRLADSRTGYSLAPQDSSAIMGGRGPQVPVTSTSVRNAVFEEWKKRKEEKLKGTKKDLKKLSSNKLTAGKTREENENYKKKCDEAVENWHLKKKEAEKKRLKEQKELKEKEDKEKRERMERVLNASENTMQDWIKCKTKKLQEEHKKKLQQEKELQEKIKQEEIEKEEATKKAFDTWKKQKDEKIKEAQRIEQLQIAQKKKEAESQAMERSKDSDEARKAWEKQKLSSCSDVSLSRNAELQPAWRPARAMKYAYPKHMYSNQCSEDDKELKIAHKQQTKTTAVSQTKMLGKDKQLTKKTVHVCCQTLEYWCSCDD